MFFFKKKSQDFIVEENLPFKLSWSWDAYYVLIEKRNKSTGEILQHLTSTFKISRMTIGIAGLKDKKAISRQWISIYKRALKKLGGEQVWLDALMQVATVKEKTRHEIPLNLSVPITNTFHIRLRAEQNIWVSDREATQTSLEGLLSKWYPNVFGAQRFGSLGKNHEVGQEIAQWTSKLLRVKHPDRKEIIFKLQSYSSYIFNAYVFDRIKSWLKLIDWDILQVDPAIEALSYGSRREEKKDVTLFEDKHTSQMIKNPKWLGKSVAYSPDTMYLTGPNVWSDLLLPTPTSDAWRYEKAFLKEHGITDKVFKVFAEWKVFGLRRRLRVKPTKRSVRRQWDDVLLQFTLPSGSYASTLVSRMKKEVWITDSSLKKQTGKKFKKQSNR